jgi:hypothetical protein
VNLSSSIDLSGNWGWLKSVVKRSLSVTLFQLWEAIHDPLPYEVPKIVACFSQSWKRQAQIICKIMLKVIMKSHTYSASATIFVTLEGKTLHLENPPSENGSHKHMKTRRSRVTLKVQSFFHYWYVYFKNISLDLYKILTPYLVIK